MRKVRTLLKKVSEDNESVEVEQLVVTPSNSSSSASSSSRRSNRDILRKFKVNSGDCIRNAYDVRRSVRMFPTTGILSSSLPEDVFSLIDVQLQVLTEFINEKGNKSHVSGNVEARDYYTEGVLAIFDHLRTIHESNKVSLLTSFDECCSSANDFWRMSEKMESIMKTILTRTGGVDAVVITEGENLVSSFSTDAVYAAERLQVFVMRDIYKHTTIRTELFSTVWEEEYTQNELVLKLLQILDCFLSDCKKKLCVDFLYQKALIACVKAVVCLYTRCLIEKADSIRHRRKRDKLRMKAREKAFHSTFKALLRMKDDLDLIQNFFAKKAGYNQALARIVAHEIQFLYLLHECLSTCDLSNLETFIVVIHKRTGATAVVTRHFVADLWLIINQRCEQKQVKEKLKMLQTDLDMVSKSLEEQNCVSNVKPDASSFIQLDEMLKDLYTDRIGQDGVPVCWEFLPETESEDSDGMGKRVKKLTKSLLDIRLKC